MFHIWFYSPLLDENEFSVATHHYAEALVKLRNIEAKPTPRSPVVQTPMIRTAVLTLFRDSLTMLDGYSDRRTANIPEGLDTDIVTLEVHDYRNGVPSEVLEQFDANGGATGLGKMGEQVGDFFERLEVVCGNTVLGLARIPDAVR